MKNKPKSKIQNPKFEIRDSFVKVDPDTLKPVQFDKKTTKYLENEKEKLAWYKIRGRVMRWVDLIIFIWKKFYQNRSLEMKIKSWLKLILKIF